MRPFDVCGPLPVGTTVLEASAGTGKTFTIASLATRYVAEGVADLDQLMIVTFTRAATQELRERVRERLAGTATGLADPAAARAGDDTLLQLLADAPADEVERRRQRLTGALARFDAATIATTHGFCQQMLAGLGMAGDTEPGATFVDRIDDLVTEVVTDLYLRKFAYDETPPAITVETAMTVARQSMADRQARLIPADAAPGSTAQQRHGMALAVRREVERRKRTRHLLDYDDLLSRLRDALEDDERGPAACARIRSRYQVVLVDEFQDTDPVQWQILRRAFHGHRTLVLIGDPKQAIYAFRGADLVTYLAAAHEAGSRCTLGRNWRSDEGLLQAIASVFGGAALGDRRIVLRPVEAQHTGRRLQDAGSPLRLRLVSRADAELAHSGKLTVGVARPLVAADVAADVVTLLQRPALLTVDGTERAIQPSDIAVLVRTNDQAALVRDALESAQVPAVLTGTVSVFLSRMAQDWLMLLRAVEDPHRSGLVRAAALTAFVGRTAEDLATANEHDLDELGDRLRRWREALVRNGVAALLEAVTSSTGLLERLLSYEQGERMLTDLRHIGQALHAAAVEQRLGPAALVEWLQQRIADAGQDSSEERSRRLESDADAVQVITVHSSKGLEFPIVYVPFGWDRFAGDNPDPLRLHDDEGNRLLYVGGADGPDYAPCRDRHQAEEFGEDLRLLYVALTRAQCQTVIWWVPSTNTPGSPLHRLLFGGAADGEPPPPRVPLPTDAVAREHLEALAAASAGAISVEPVATGPTARWEQPTAEPEPLTAARLDRHVDTAWRRTSYTGLTATAHQRLYAGATSEPEREERQDEPALPAPPPGAGTEPEAAARTALTSVPSPMGTLPSGPAFGTLVHEVLERVDTAAPDLEAELSARCGEAVSSRLAAAVHPATLAHGLLATLGTPLGAIGGDRPLRDYLPADRLPELDFELPLAGGDSPRSTYATIGTIADLLRRHLPATDPLAGYPDALDVPQLAAESLRGYLTGSIDAVLRVQQATGDPRYVVVDYKTNWLGDFGSSAAPLSAWHYRPSALAAEMVHAHYPLQALLYSVALHRFLRWRQPGYSPERHLGGALYLFVRGMCGAATPVVDGQPCGIFSWSPPPALVAELSRHLDGAT